MGPLGKYLLRSVIRLVIALFVTSAIVFGALYLAPGDPISQLAGGRPLTPQQEKTLRAEYNLDRPLPERYVDYLGDVLHGNFGTSIAFQQPVSELIKSRIGTTIWLLILTSILIAVAGVGLGVLAARRPGFIDDSVLISTTIGLATPSFVVAAVLIAVFAVDLGWFPIFGSGGSSVGSKVEHLTLPAIALSLASIGFVARTGRTSLRVEQRRDYFNTAISRGIPERTAFRRHVLRNAMIPISTAIGLSIASIVVGTTVVEVAFGLNGLGSLLVQSVLRSDFPTVQAVSLILVVTFVVVNTLVDILYVLLDPRVELGTANR
ncbi:MAG: ABC transporter permease [Actinobacteria bacterium]|nr:ABC transporter permease [Actinomycetota bacterium]